MIKWIMILIPPVLMTSMLMTVEAHSRCHLGELYDTAAVPVETKPMGGLLSSQKEAEKGGVKEDEEGGKSGASATAWGKGLAGISACCPVPCVSSQAVTPPFTSVFC